MKRFWSRLYWTHPPQPQPLLTPHPFLHYLRVPRSILSREDAIAEWLERFISGVPLWNRLASHSGEEEILQVTSCPWNPEKQRQYEMIGSMQTLPKDSEAEKRGKGAYPNTVFLFLVPQILLLVVLMCMSLSLASFVSLTGPGEFKDWDRRRQIVIFKKTACF